MSQRSFNEQRYKKKEKDRRQKERRNATFSFSQLRTKKEDEDDGDRLFPLKYCNVFVFAVVVVVEEGMGLSSTN